MYNINNIKKIEAEIQKEIDKVVEKYTPIMQAALEKEMMKGHEFITGMGTSFIQNKNRDYVAEEFTDHVNLLTYKDYFHTGLDLLNVTKS